MIKRLTLGLFAPIIVAAIATRSTQPIPSLPSAPPRIEGSAAPDPMTDVPAEIVIEERVPVLPTGVTAFTRDAWANLELEILFDLGSRPAVMERYRIEKDPAYKGLLAVVLSADPSTHEMILGDLVGSPGQDSDLFRGLALYALIKERSLESSHRQDVWNWLMIVLDERRRAGEIELRLTRGIPYMWAYVEGSRDERIRQMLRSYSDSDGPWVLDLVHEGLTECARRDPNFASILLNQVRVDRLRETLECLTRAHLHEQDVLAVSEWAKRRASDRGLVSTAAWVLEAQRTSFADAELRTLYRQSEGDAETSRLILQRMESNPEAFEDLALSALKSGDADVRGQALELLDRGKWKDTFLRVLITDPEPEPRRVAARKIRWALALGKYPLTTDLHAALRNAMESDPYDEVREFARRALEQTELHSDDF